MSIETTDTNKDGVFVWFTLFACLIFHFSIIGAALVFTDVIGQWAVTPLISAAGVGVVLLGIAVFEPVKDKVLSLWGERFLRSSGFAKS